MWCETLGDVETRARPITKGKTLISVFWNFVGFNHIIDIPPGQTYTSEFCTSTIIPSLDAELRSSRPQLGLTGTCLHWDNARPHVANNTREDLMSRRVRLLPHPPYSPDLSPSDFFLFGYLKYRIQGQKFATSAELVTNLGQIMGDIGRDMLQKV
jgi:histone-lysine N-methyltransferase SETMAR